MYNYIEDKALRNELREYCEGIILSVQKHLSDYFTFSFKLIGSGDSRLMMTNGKNNSIDLDYNLVIQRDKKQLINDPSKIKNIFMQAFKKICGNRVKVSDSTQVITCTVGNFHKYFFSFDLAIFVDANDGFIYKLISDKQINSIRYIWNKVPKSKNYEANLLFLKRKGLWEEIKNRYKDKKNMYLRRQSQISSFEILLSVINEMMQIYE